MANTSKYKERIFKEIKALPEEALPKVARLISLIREEFITEEPFLAETDDKTNHKRTRSLLSTSKGNWAHEIISKREDRI
jgi:hypothetical protein